MPAAHAVRVIWTQFSEQGARLMRPGVRKRLYVPVFAIYRPEERLASYRHSRS
jgi:hypothetical protein